MVFLTLLLLFIWFVGALYKTFKGAAGGAMEFPAFVANLSWPITVFKKTEKSVEKSQAAAHPSIAVIAAQNSIPATVTGDTQISSTSADVTSATSATSTITAAPISTITVPPAQT